MTDQLQKPDDAGLKRRALLAGVVKIFTLLGLGFAAVPFVKSLLPSFENDVSMDVDISRLAPNQSMLVEWLGRRIIVYRRSSRVLAELETIPAGILKDHISSASRQPAFALNPFRSMRPEILVVYSNCTHLGCEIAVNHGEQQSRVGFKCPCHQSDYDHSGRVLENQAAPYNLEVPNYTFVSGEVIRLLAS